MIDDSAHHSRLMYNSEQDRKCGTNKEATKRFVNDSINLKEINGHFVSHPTRRFAQNGPPLHRRLLITSRAK